MEEFRDKLIKVGFTESEAKVFLAMFGGAQMRATDIAKRADIRRTDVYGILKTFVQKGFINEIETNTVTKFEIIDPIVIADKIEEDLKHTVKKSIEKTKTIFSELLPLYENRDREKKDPINIELVRGFNKHRHIRFIELMDRSKKEILLMNRLEGYISRQVDEVTNRFINRGGILKSIYEVSLNFKIAKEKGWSSVTLDDLLELCEFYENNGEQIKLTKLLIANITIFDREIVFLNIQDKAMTQSTKSDIIIKNRDFAQFMANVFEMSWNQAFIIEEFRQLTNLIR